MTHLETYVPFRDPAINKTNQTAVYKEPTVYEETATNKNSYKQKHQSPPMCQLRRYLLMSSRSRVHMCCISVTQYP